MFYPIQKVNPILKTNALNSILGVIHSYPDLDIEHKDVQNILTLKNCSARAMNCSIILWIEENKNKFDPLITSYF